MNEHFTTLQSIGLSDKEAAVYLTLLELGGGTAQHIATQSKVKRGTVYTIVESLMKKGLASISQVQTKNGGTKQTFHPEDPSALDQLLVAREHALKNAREEAQTTIHELRRLHVSRGTRPVVRHFEGVEGLKMLAKDISETGEGERSMSFTDLDSMVRLFPGSFMTTDTSRIRKKRLTKILYTCSKGPVAGMKSPDHFREAQWVSFKNKIDFEGDITVYGNKVSISTFRSPQVSVLLEHEDIARLVEALFTLAWEAAQERGEPENGATLRDLTKNE
jgi:sugar-specific transcriptional regulator TrmB